MAKNTGKHIKQIQGLVLDGLTKVFNSLAPEKQLFFALTCKDLLKLYTDTMTKAQRKYRTVYLRNKQLQMKRIFETTKGIISVNAPKSFGKTILGYACVDKHFAVITCPSGVFKHWKAEAEKLGMYDSDPEYTKVFLNLSKNKKHSDYLKGILDGTIDYDRKYMILITTDGRGNVGGQLTGLDKAEAIMKKVKPAHAELRFIVDEGHKDNRRNVIDFIQSMKPTRTMFMSGSNINERKLGIGIPFTKAFYTHAEDTMEKLPEADWFLPMLNTIPEFNNYMKSLVDDYKKIVFSASGKEAQDLGIIQKVIENGKATREYKKWYRAKIFVLKSTLNTVKQFEEYDGRAILVINTLSNEGLNINADCIVINNSWTMNISRVVQTAARIVRTENKRPFVEVHLICDSKNTVYRAQYCKVFSTPHWTFPIIDLPKPEFLSKVMSIYRFFNLYQDQENYADACVLLTDYTFVGINKEAIITWWKEHKLKRSVLTEESLRNFIGI